MKKAVGYALFFNIYSPWEGRSLYLEDLYVDSAFRGEPFDQVDSLLLA